MRFALWVKLLRGEGLEADKSTPSTPRKAGRKPWPNLISVRIGFSGNQSLSHCDIAGSVSKTHDPRWISRLDCPDQSFQSDGSSQNGILVTIYDGLATPIQGTRNPHLLSRKRRRTTTRSPADT